MARDRESSALQRGRRRRAPEQFPQLAAAPDDYPMFPDKSTWPVPFPELPPTPGDGPRRPPQHTSKAVAPRIEADHLPNHVAIVMDGNGRWATQRGLHRTEGHKMGEAVLIDVTCGAIELGVKWLSFMRSRPRTGSAAPRKCVFSWIQPRGGPAAPGKPRRDGGADALGGIPSRMWRSVIKEFEIAEDMTLNNDVITINYCVNYGGRSEIVEATREIARQAAAGQLNPDRVTETTLSRHLHRPDIPDVDLFIRTSGEQRASNFMLWQSAYAEYVFQDKLWPDYDRRDLWAACEQYVNRNRRFGSA